MLVLVQMGSYRENVDLIEEEVDDNRGIHLNVIESYGPREEVEGDNHIDLFHL